MSIRKSLLAFCLCFAVLWSLYQAREYNNLIEMDNYIQSVRVVVVDLPPCNRSNPIVVRYKVNNYTLYVPKSDCVNRNYEIGQSINAYYNPLIDRLMLTARKDMLGTRNLYLILSFLLLVSLLIVIVSKKRN